MNVKTDGMGERVARIRATIRDYGPDDWFQGCSHGGGIYMRDLRPVLDAACHHAELVEALRRISDYRSEAEDLTPEETIWRMIDEMQEIALTVLAKIGGDQ